MAWYDTLSKAVGGWGQNTLGGSLLGGLGGVALGSILAPKVATPSAAQLNAAVIPGMEAAANTRKAALAGALGAKGGMSSADLYEKAALNQELARGIGMQQVQNQIQADQLANSANRQRFQDIMSGGMLGYRLMNPLDQEYLKKILEQANAGGTSTSTPTAYYPPTPVYVPGQPVRT